jgi:hypothetical protein
LNHLQALQERVSIQNDFHAVNLQVFFFQKKKEDFVVLVVTKRCGQGEVRSRPREYDTSMSSTAGISVWRKPEEPGIKA